MVGSVESSLSLSFVDCVLAILDSKYEKPSFLPAKAEETSPFVRSSKYGSNPWTTTGWSLGSAHGDLSKAFLMNSNS